MNWFEDLAVKMLHLKTQWLFTLITRVVMHHKWYISEKLKLKKLYAVQQLTSFMAIFLFVLNFLFQFFKVFFWWVSLSVGDRFVIYFQNNKSQIDPSPCLLAVFSNQVVSINFRGENSLQNRTNIKWPHSWVKSAKRAPDPR